MIGTNVARHSYGPLADALVWDNHLCLPMDPVRNLASLDSLETFRREGVDVVSINAGFGNMPWERSVALLARMRRWLMLRPERFRLAATAQDIEAAKAAGQLAVVFDIEGAATLEGRPELVQLYHDLGVRWMLLAYNRANWAGGGCHDDEDRGLTAAGRELVEEMERVGVVVCCSHAGPRTAADLLDRARAPVIFSHSNAAALRPHPRNIDDDLIRACARTGGAVGINGVNAFLGGPDAGVEELADHVEHMAGVGGVEHVSIALDWTDADDLAKEVVAAGALFPSGYGYDQLRVLGPEALPRLTELLLRRRWTDADVRKVLGGNLLRIARTAWRGRRDLEGDRRSTPAPPAASGARLLRG